MTRFLLVRHASHDVLGKRLVGRRPGVHLSEAGFREAQELAQRLASAHLGALYSSPLERARETAEAIALPHLLQVRTLPALQEFDFGSWTGSTFDELAELERWQHFNRFRSGTRAPEGEHMLDVQARMVTLLERLQVEHGSALVALVGHGDPLRALLAYYLGMPLDLVQRLEIAPASVSVLELEPHGARVLGLNQTSGLY
jgi:probable phosphoglycerate mutase